MLPPARRHRRRTLASCQDEEDSRYIVKDSDEVSTHQPRLPCIYFHSCIPLTPSNPEQEDESTLEAQQHEQKQEQQQQQKAQKEQQQADEAQAPDAEQRQQRLAGLQGIAPNCTACRLPLLTDVQAVADGCGHVFHAACCESESWRGCSHEICKRGRNRSRKFTKLFWEPMVVLETLVFPGDDDDDELEMRGFMDAGADADGDADVEELTAQLEAEIAEEEQRYQTLKRQVRRDEASRSELSQKHLRTHNERVALERSLARETQARQKALNDRDESRHRRVEMEEDCEELEREIKACVSS